MLPILKEDLTEYKIRDDYKYKDLLHVINRITQLIAELEVTKEFLTYADEEDIRKNKIKKFDLLIDDIENQMQYAKKQYQDNLAIGQGGDTEKLIRNTLKNN